MPQGVVPMLLKNTRTWPNHKQRGKLYGGCGDVWSVIAVQIEQNPSNAASSP